MVVWIVLGVLRRFFMPISRRHRFQHTRQVRNPVKGFLGRQVRKARLLARILKVSRFVGPSPKLVERKAGPDDLRLKLALGGRFWFG